MKRLDAGEMIDAAARSRLAKLFSAIVTNAGVGHLVEDLILQALRIESIHSADMHQLEGAISMARSLSLFQSRTAPSLRPPTRRAQDHHYAKRGKAR